MLCINQKDLQSIKLFGSGEESANRRLELNYVPCDYNHLNQTNSDQEAKVVKDQEEGFKVTGKKCLVNLDDNIEGKRAREEKKKEIGKYLG